MPVISEKDVRDEDLVLSVSAKHPVEVKAVEEGNRFQLFKMPLATLSHLFELHRCCSHIVCIQYAICLDWNLSVLLLMLSTKSSVCKNSLLQARA